MAQRHNRWIAGCGDDRGGRAGKLKQQNARRTRNLRVSLIVWWIARNRRVVWSLSVSALQKAGGTKGERTNDEKYMKKSTQTEPQSTKNRSWAAFGAQSRFGDASGHARGASGTPKWRPKADQVTPRVTQERPGGVQKRPQASSEALREPPGHIPRLS